MRTGDVGAEGRDEGHAAMFCGLPLSVGMTAESVVARAFRPSGEPVLTTFINPGAIHVARVNAAYGRVLARFDMILPDGIGIVWGWRAIHRSRLTRLSFDTTSLALPVLRKARDEARRVMLIGGMPGVPEAAVGKLSAALPGLRFCQPQHGYHPSAAYEVALRAERPDVVICGMGAPRQEEMLLALRDSGLLSGPAFTCGGYLDQLHDGLDYYPAFIDSLNLRWLYRMSREPHRLWRRYLLEYPEYALALAQDLREMSAAGRSGIKERVR
ncbi:MAG TPA: WecB/TagA/CpsF family glycosyltransferase [Woeseiaceae bacterium]|nr:WecB/TagA/CpsF family glycosyltransferase [Woeseiaceae bacterium]